MYHTALRGIRYLAPRAYDNVAEFRISAGRRVVSDDSGRKEGKERRTEGGRRKEEKVGPSNEGEE